MMVYSLAIVTDVAELCSSIPTIGQKINKMANWYTSPISPKALFFTQSIKNIGDISPFYDMREALKL